MKRQKNIDTNTIDINKSYVEIDGIGWRQPIHITIKSMMELVQKEITDDINIKFVTFKNQDTSVFESTNLFNKDNLQLSLDKNFLYVWADDRWKRIPLSEF